MADYHIQPNSRRCVATGRDLRPGEKYYSVLIEDGERFVRQDFSTDGWTGPPEAAFSFWMGRVPDSNEKAKPRFDDDLLLDCFQRLEGQADPSRINFRYVLALLLMRRRKLKFEESREQDGVEQLCLRCLKTGTEHLVINPQLTEEAMLQVQEEVIHVLGWD